MNEKLKWRDIKNAPKIVGNPLWCRGFNHGKEDQGYHYTWAYWDGSCWYDQMGVSQLLYLTEYLEDRK